MWGRGVRRAGLAAALAVAAPALGACSPGGSAPPPGTLAVVASTDVWGDVATAVAGSQAGHKVRITSILDRPGLDPHSYEADARDQLSVDRANLIVENGGGYDDFMTDLRKAAGRRAPVLDAVRIAGPRAHVNGELNEHVWYDFPTVARVAGRIARAMAAADPSDAALFSADARRFTTRLRALEATEAAIRRSAGGVRVAITEPVPRYLLTACGLVDATPPAFSRAAENGTGVSARVLHQTLALVSSGTVRLLAYNEQTSGPITERVLEAARAGHVPVVPFTETLPAGRHFLGWMAQNLAAVRSALAGDGT